VVNGPGQWRGRKQELIKSMVDELFECGKFRLEQERDDLISAMIDAGAQLTVRNLSDPRSHLFAIVRACVREGHLPVLVDTVTTFLGAGPVPARLRLLLDEWQLADQLPDEVLNALYKVLDPAILSDPPNLADLYRRAVQSRLSAPPADRDSTWKIVTFLAGQNSGEDGVPPFMIFLGLIADQVGGETGRTITSQLRQLASHWEMTEAYQHAFWARPRPEILTRPPAILIMIEPDGIDHDKYIIMHWLQCDLEMWAPERGTDRKVERADLENAVRTVILEAEAKTVWPKSSSLVWVEFILPFELLDIPVERWRKEDDEDGGVPLIVHHPIVLRSLDRIRNPARRRVWDARWQRAVERPTTSEVLFSTGQEYHEKLEPRLTLDDNITGLVLSEPPDVTRPDAGRELRIAMRCGIPIIIWHRRDCRDPAFREAIMTLLADGGLAELPIRAQRLRLNAMVSDDGSTNSIVASDLTVLWDDPNRIPEGISPTGSEGDLTR
jgi:hypothetical protein